MKKFWGCLCIIGCFAGIYMIFVSEDSIQVFASIFFISISGTLACICFATSKYISTTNSQHKKIATNHNETVSREQSSIPNSNLPLYEDDVQDLLAWQNILYPNTAQLRFNAGQLKQLSAYTIPRQSEIAHDCMELVNSTAVPETFFSRYDLMLEKLTLLSELEKYVRFNTYSPTQQLDSAIRKKPLATKAFIDRYLDATTTKASSLKTEKGKRNRYKKAYDVFLKYSEKMTDENILYFKNKYANIQGGNEYSSIILSNGKTISEQQEIDFKKTQGIYLANTPRFLDMWIFSNTVPPKENYAVLNSNEKSFFYCFHTLLLKASVDPACIQLTRLSSGTFDVKYVGLCYVGKIDLYQSPPTYAVIKNGNKKATKVFSSNNEAEKYIARKQNYIIEMRQGKSSFYMQYEDSGSTKELWNLTLEQYISYIPYWIRHIKKCLDERSEWLN